MIALPNMGLVKWDQIDDFFSHEQLAANFQALDDHDHTPGNGVQIPYGGLANLSVGPENLREGTFIASKLGDNSIETAKIKDAAITTAKLGDASVTKAKLASGLGAIQLYTPKIIATEQSRENTSFGVLTTADEIEDVVVPANALVLVGYSALCKSSVSAAGSIALFIGANQLKSISAGVPTAQEAATSGTGWNRLSSAQGGIRIGGTSATADVTTGQTLSLSNSEGGLCVVHSLAAATYDFSIQFKASSGSVTAKERKLWVAVIG